MHTYSLHKQETQSSHLSRSVFLNRFSHQGTSEAVNPYIPSEGAHRDPQVQSVGFLGGPGYKLKSKGEASSPREQRQRSLFLHHPPEGEAGSHKRSGGARLQSGQPNSESAWAAEASGCGGGGRRPFPRLGITPTAGTRHPKLSSLPYHPSGLFSQCQRWAQRL